MAATFQVEVITPERSVFEGEATSVRVPTTDGSIGILANHAPLVSTVAVGDLEVALAGGGREHFLVGDGFLEVQGNHVRVLAEVGEAASQIDVERAERAVTRARTRLDKRSDPEVDAARADAALRRALMRLRVAKYPKSL